MKKEWFAQVDVSEQQIHEHYRDEHVLETLLLDRTTGQNILWGTDDYCQGETDTDYAHGAQIKVELITGEQHEGIIKPRVMKSRDAQKARAKDKAEVFTPAWICNAQNNLVDEAWFGYNAQLASTQHLSKDKFAFVPLQDFAHNTPID